MWEDRVECNYAKFKSNWKKIQRLFISNTNLAYNWQGVTAFIYVALHLQAINDQDSFLTVVTIVVS